MWTTRKSKKSKQSSLNITCSRWNIDCTVWFITHISTCESNDADKDRVAVLHQDLGSPTASHLINNLFLIPSLKVLLKKNITGSWQSKLQRSYVSIRYLICFTGSPCGKKTRAGVIGGKVFHAEGGGLPGWIPANATSVVWCLFLSVSGRGESDATASLFDTALNPLCMKASDWYWNIHHTLVVPDHWSAEDAICMRWDHLGSHNLTTEHPRTYCWVFFMRLAVWVRRLESLRSCCVHEHSGKQEGKAFSLSWVAEYERRIHQHVVNTSLTNSWSDEYLDGMLYAVSAGLKTDRRSAQVA